MKIRHLAQKTGTLFLNMSLALSGMLLVTQCTQDDDIVNNEKKLSPSIQAQFCAMEDPHGSRTKITPDGKVSWDSDDRIKAFIVPTGTSQFVGNDYLYVTDYPDCDISKFNPAEYQGLALTPGTAYDWYVMSPYSDQVKDPVGGTSSATAFSFDNQEQDCSRPTAHLTKYDIMTGVVKNLDAESSVTFNMSHKGTLMKFTFVNQLAESVRIRTVEFVASEGINIGGTYSIDFEQDGVLTPMDAKNTNTLHLLKSKPIATGESLDTYTMMPAFTLLQGSSLTIRVYTDKGMLEQRMSAKKDMAFRAGTINTAKVSMKVLKPVFFADGVTKTSGWYDVNKKGDGRTDEGDAVMCWAAASANMLEWWQDRYVEGGGTLPSTAVTGVGERYELAIFELYQKFWNNLHGGQVYCGIPWYLSGEDRARDLGYQEEYYALPIKGSGGYFKSVWKDLEAMLGVGKNYVTYYEAYATWGPWGDNSKTALRIVTDLIVNAFDSGMASLSVRSGTAIQHAITLWGYELNEKGLLSRVYVSDSDDLIGKPQAPRVQLMQNYEVKEQGDREVYLLGTYAGALEITQIVPFMGLPVR